MEQLANNLNIEGNVLKRAESLEERIWIDSNISKIDELLRINYDKSVKEFSEIILNAVADLLNSLRGAFYLVEHQEEKIIAKAGYGCTLETMGKTEFNYGDDLIGFAVKSKKTRYLKNLPLNNAVISSGLAQVSSSALIISPLIFNDVVYGVLELNNLEEFDTKSLQVIDRLSRNIASTLQSIINNEATKNLVRQLQQTTKEMEAQDEEIRQNMEELETTRDEMENQKKELEFRNIELNEKNSEMLAQEEELRQNMEELSAIKDEMEKQHETIKEKNKELKTNEAVLLKAIVSSKEKQKRLKKLENKYKNIKGFNGNQTQINFTELFNLQEIQKYQDEFAKKTGLSSIITSIDGVPLTKPSNYSYLYENVLTNSKIGFANLKKNRVNLIEKLKDGTSLIETIKGGIYDGGINIYIGKKHIANWFIGQFVTPDFDETKLLKYAKEINTDEVEFKKAIKLITKMSLAQYKTIADLLSVSSKYFTEIALRNFTQSVEIAKDNK